MTKSVNAIWTLAFLLLWACGSRREIQSDGVVKMKESDLKDSVLAAQNQVKTLQLRYRANWSSPSSTQAFRLELRLLADSAVWIDVADPILGIKVVRLLVEPHRYQYVNKLQSQYAEGSIAELQRQFNIAFDFYDLQAIMLSNILESNLEGYSAYPTKEAYLLANYPQDPDEQAKVAAGQEQFARIEIEPQNFKPQFQEFNEPVNGRRLGIAYAGWVEREKLLLARLVQMEIVAGDKSSLELELNDARVNVDLPIPFSIPNGYSRLP